MGCRYLAHPGWEDWAQLGGGRPAGVGGWLGTVGAVTTLPLWAVYLVSFGTPVGAFVGVVLGHFLLRKGANELDVWRRREETMRLLRWASELAASPEPARASMGVAALEALGTSELLQKPDQALVDAVLDSLLEQPVEQITQARGGVQVVEVDDGYGRESLEY